MLSLRWTAKRVGFLVDMSFHGLSFQRHAQVSWEYFGHDPHGKDVWEQRKASHHHPHSHHRSRLTSSLMDPFLCFWSSSLKWQAWDVSKNQIYCFGPWSFYHQLKKIVLFEPLENCLHLKPTAHGWWVLLLSNNQQQSVETILYTVPTVKLKTVGLNNPERLGENAFLKGDSLSVNGLDRRVKIQPSTFDRFMDHPHFEGSFQVDKVRCLFSLQGTERVSDSLLKQEIRQVNDGIGFSVRLRCSMRAVSCFFLQLDSSPSNTRFQSNNPNWLTDGRKSTHSSTTYHTRVNSSKTSRFNPLCVTLCSFDFYRACT